VRGLVQRVDSAAVDVVDGEVSDDAAARLAYRRVGQIGNGLCVLVGVTHDDTAANADKLADKIWNLRVFDDVNGVMNESLADVFDAARAAPESTGGNSAQVLVVSQFTLYGDTRKGRRPSWIDAARPEHAEPLVERVVDRLRALGAEVATGRFRTEMRLTIVNDGPVTLMLEV
jgi:D-tyrosyl-tRNA(Tyr) deacylase